MNRLKNSTMSKASSYLVFKILAYGVSIISIPILTKYFSTAEYGKISLIEATVSLIISFFTLGIPQAYIRYYNVAEKDNKVESYDYSMYMMICVIIIFCFVFTFELYIFQGDFGSQLSFIIAVIASVSVGIQQFLSYIRARGHAYLHSFLIGINDILGFLIPLFAIILLNYKIEIYFLAQSSVSTIMMLILLLNLKKYIHRSKIDFLAISNVLKYGIPLLLVSVGSSLFGSGDRIVINNLLGSEMVALYTVPAKIANAIQQVIIYPISMVVFPQYIKLWEREGKEATEVYLSKGIEFYAFLAIPIVFGTFLLKNELITVLSNEQYTMYSNILPILVTSMLTYGCYYFVVAGLFLENKTLLLGLIMFISASGKIVLNIVGAKLFGLIGVCIATALSYVGYLLLEYYFSRKIVRVSFSIHNLVWFLVSSCVMLIIIKIIPQPNNLFIKIIMSIIEGVTVYSFLNYKYIWRLFQRYLRR